MASVVSIREGAFPQGKDHYVSSDPSKQPNLRLTGDFKNISTIGDSLADEIASAYRAVDSTKQHTPMNELYEAFGKKKVDEVISGMNYEELRDEDREGRVMPEALKQQVRMEYGITNFERTEFGVSVKEMIEFYGSDVFQKAYESIPNENRRPNRILHGEVLTGKSGGNARYEDIDEIHREWARFTYNSRSGTKKEAKEAWEDATGEKISDYMFDKILEGQEKKGRNVNWRSKSRKNDNLESRVSLGNDSLESGNDSDKLLLETAISYEDAYQDLVKDVKLLAKSVNLDGSPLDIRLDLERQYGIELVEEAIGKRPKRPLTAEEEERICNAYEEGYTIRDILDGFEETFERPLSSYELYSTLKKRGIKTRKAQAEEAQGVLDLTQELLGTTEHGLPEPKGHELTVPQENTPEQGMLSSIYTTLEERVTPNSNNETNSLQGKITLPQETDYDTMGALPVGAKGSDPISVDSNNRVSSKRVEAPNSEKLPSLEEIFKNTPIEVLDQAMPHAISRAGELNIDDATEKGKIEYTAIVLEEIRRIQSAEEADALELQEDSPPIGIVERHTDGSPKLIRRDDGEEVIFPRDEYRIEANTTSRKEERGDNQGNQTEEPAYMFSQKFLDALRLPEQQDEETPFLLTVESHSKDRTIHPYTATDKALLREAKTPLIPTSSQEETQSEKLPRLTATQFGTSNSATYSTDDNSDEIHEDMERQNEEHREAEGERRAERARLFPDEQPEPRRRRRSLRKVAGAAAAATILFGGLYYSTFGQGEPTPSQPVQQTSTPSQEKKPTPPHNTQTTEETLNKGVSEEKRDESQTEKARVFWGPFSTVINNYSDTTPKWSGEHLGEK